MSAVASRRGHLPHPGAKVVPLLALYTASYFGSDLVRPQGRLSQLHLQESSSPLELEWLLTSCRKQGQQWLRSAVPDSD